MFWYLRIASRRLFWQIFKIYVLRGNHNKTRSFLHVILRVKDSLKQEIHFNGNIFRNRCCPCSEGSLCLMICASAEDSDLPTHSVQSDAHILFSHQYIIQNPIILKTDNKGTGYTLWTFRHFYKGDNFCDFITKIRLFKYIENFTEKKLKVFR